MNDTSPDVEARLAALYASRSGSERVRMACDMFDTARALILARIQSESPALTSAELRVKLFEALYGNDFSPATRARIVARLRT